MAERWITDASPLIVCATMCLEMLAATNIGSFISRRPEIRGGRPLVAGTGVAVHRIAGWSKLGLSPEEIAENFGHLSLAQVHAALAYYHANREEIERYLREDEEADPGPPPEPSSSSTHGPRGGFSTATTSRTSRRFTPSS